MLICTVLLTFRFMSAVGKTLWCGMGSSFRNRFGYLLCFSLVISVIYIVLIGWKVQLNERLEFRARYLTGERRNVSQRGTETITVFLRMPGKLKKYRTRFYCDYLRTSTLFWPAQFGKTVVVLDEESEQDHAFGNNLMEQINEHFPNRKLEVLYESLPYDQSILRGKLQFGYSRQLWSSFFIDLYSTDKIIAWMDTDAAFITPVTQKSIFNGTKLRMLGCECTMGLPIMKMWAHATMSMLGMPMLANFMTYFPVYLYRDTFTNCREYVLKRFNTTNFEEVWEKWYRQGELTMISPVNIVISYAWFLERDRYDWNIHLCSDLNVYNQRFPAGHTIGLEHTVKILSEPQTAFHVPYTPFLSSRILVSYCLSHAAAGNTRAICSKHSVVSLSDNLVLFNNDMERVKNLEQTQCTGNNTKVCLDILERHYNTVGLEIKTDRRRVEWGDLEIVEKLAKEVDIRCESLTVMKEN